jgi:hypothetical protein
MKTSSIVIFAVVAIFCCSGIAFSDSWKNESGKGSRDKSQYHQTDRNKQQHSGRQGDQDYKKHPDTHSRRHVEKRHEDHRGHSGYRERPHGKTRHYTYYNHHGHRYEYKGHWKSWKEWDRYAKKHPEIRKHGSYYHRDTHLMFRFCDPITNGCVYFSIGR